MYEKLDDFHLICGDLNARTRREKYSRNDSLYYDDNERDGNDDSDDLPLKRNSDDRETNVFGKQLLEVCNKFDCVILNGLCQRGFNDSCTYISSSGCSTIDYVLISIDLCSIIWSVIMHQIESFTCLYYTKNLRCLFNAF